MAITSYCKNTSSVSDNGNYKGTQSCFDVFSVKTDDVKLPCEKKVVTCETQPPQILSSMGPSVLKRENTSDGRLLLKEEKVRAHPYFRAHKSNGRFKLQLVSPDADDRESG